MVFLERKRRAQGIFLNQIEDIFGQQFLFRWGTKIKPSLPELPLMGRTYAGLLSKSTSLSLVLLLLLLCGCVAVSDVTML